MADFATITSLELLVGADTGDLGDIALRAASAAIVSAIHWDPRQSERTARAIPAGVVFLPALNVTAVAVTGAGGLAIATNAYTWTDDGQVDFGPAPRYRGAPTVTITYTAGWANLPDVFEIVCLEEAERWLQNRGQLVKSRSWVLGAEQEAESYDVSGVAAGLAADPRLGPYVVDPAVA